jgi:lysophospholipase L1-like esterase
MTPRTNPHIHGSSPVVMLPPAARPHSRARSVLLNVVTLLAGAVAAVLLLELLLQIHNPFLARIKGDRIVLLTNTHQRIRNYTIPSLDREITMTRNSIGFRGADPPADFAKYLTIFAIGGSSTQCFYLSDDATWPARLGDRLARSFRSVWINNAGLDGHSSYGNLVLLQDHILKFHPKMALLMVGGNDVTKDSNPGVADGENVRGPLVLRSPTTFLRTLSAYSEVAALIANMERSWAAYHRGVLHQEIDLTRQGFVGEVSDDFRQRFLAPYRGIHLQNYEDRLRRLVQVAREAGIAPIFITQPSLVGAGIDDAKHVDLERLAIPEFPGVNGRVFWEMHDMYNDVTRRVARELNVILVDLAHMLPKSSRYFYDYEHFTNAGAGAAAEIVYRTICPGLQTQFNSYSSGACVN